MHDQIPLAIAAILLIGVGAQWLAWWLRLPAILPLLAVGLVAGPVTGWLDPDELFGQLLFPIVSLGVAVILFEGALTLKISQIRNQAGVVRNLVSFGALANWLIIAVAAHFFTALPWSLAFLFGALVTVTGPTVVAPLLRTVRPETEVANILRWEGILIDPIGALLAVLVFEFTVSEHHQHTILMFGLTIVAGMVLGLIGAWILATLMRQRLLPDYLHRVGSLALVLAVFALSNAIAAESGLLAVTVMGMVLANYPNLAMDDVLDFKETLTLLLISVLFIVLAARIDLSAFTGIGWGALALLLVILLIARPVAVWLATLGSSLDWRRKAVLAWIAPRGIVAAAVSALFALQLERLGYTQARVLAALTFMVIVVTVILQSLTAKTITRRLGVGAAEARGVLIAGGNPVARAVAKALHEREIPVILADMDWNRTRAARMSGIPVYRGDILSEHADNYLDLSNISTLLAMSDSSERNLLVSLNYRPQFGARRVYTLGLETEREESHRTRLIESHRVPRLFDESMTLARLQEALDRGDSIRTTPLTATFGFEAFREKWGEQAIPLFALDPKGTVRVFSTQNMPQPEAGWTLISLMPTVANNKRPLVADGNGQPADS